ncbi:MAG TPA: hypothetical protein VKG23_17730 [Thermoanaerobaculia bacterium]|nr:hypothetical protein [Thermoanaerobaculia bacterium]
MLLLAAVCALCASGCHHESPTQPGGASLTGTWTSTSFTFCGVGDWRTVTLVLQQSGSALTGEITTADGMHFAVSGTIESGLEIDFGPNPNTGMCTSIGLSIANITLGAGGAAAAFSGQQSGYCCGTQVGQYRFDRPVS